MEIKWRNFLNRCVLSMIYFPLIYVFSFLLLGFFLPANDLNEMDSDLIFFIVWIITVIISLPINFVFKKNDRLDLPLMYSLLSNIVGLMLTFLFISLLLILIPTVIGESLGIILVIMISTIYQPFAMLAFIFTIVSLFAKPYKEKKVIFNKDKNKSMHN